MWVGLLLLSRRSALRCGSPACSLERPPVLPVKIDNVWFDLSKFNHPGGQELLERHAGTDITELFYSNHFDTITLERVRNHQIESYQLPDERIPATTSHCPVKSAANSPLYRRLKALVHARLIERQIAWQHKFSYRPYYLRLGCLLMCLAARLIGGDLATVVAAVAAASYGVLTGRQTWTHAHNGVHNPSRIPPLMRRLLRYDFVGVVELWQLEHHAHHAHTNGEGDPDADWWHPLFTYRDVAHRGGSTATGVLAACAYPFLVPVMLTRSLSHALEHDPNGAAILWFVMLVAPLRFAIDIALLGSSNFAIALGVATLYILLTFVATHQASEANHAFEPTDCW